MMRLGIVGSHATTTASPTVWSATFGALGLDARYDPVEVDAAGLPEVERRLRGGEFTAVNVTMPHKEWAARIADVRSADVERAGAANYLTQRDGALRAHNTDMVAVRELIGTASTRSVLLCGAGGAAHGLLFALNPQDVERVVIADAVPAAASHLADAAREAGIADVEAISTDAIAAHTDEADLVVNASPLGRPPNHELVWGDGRPRPDALVYDFTYAAITPTRCEEECRRLGVRLINGWAHWYEQAAAMLPLLGLTEAAAPALREALCRTQGAVIVAGDVPTR